MDKMESIESFAEKVRWLHEPEYGDFKRKVGLYLNRLEQSLSPDRKAEMADLIGKLRQEILYTTTGDVEKTRALILAFADKIRQRIQMRH